MNRIAMVNPVELARPRGYAHGVSARGRVLYVAGQIGWDADQRFTAQDLVGQFAQALDNVLSVVRAAGGQPTDIADMTVFVTDLTAYREGLRPLGEAWRARMGRHYPAMAVVGVPGLVDPGALVEIKAVAVLHDPESEPPPQRRR